MPVALGQHGLGRRACDPVGTPRDADHRLRFTLNHRGGIAFLVVRSRTLMLLFLYGSSKRNRSICPALRLRKAVTVASASGDSCSFMGGRGPGTITPLRMR